jgi:hypothetical protein
MQKTQQFKHWRVALCFIALGALASGSQALGQADRKFQQPVLVTSSGQALDAFTVKTLLGRAGITASYDPKAMAEAIGGMKSVIIAVGASNKGFGQAGITAETETARTKAILDTAKSKNVAVLCVHIGGVERRKGLSVQFIELVCPVADHIVVSKDGNEDSYFTELSKSKGIPLTVIDRALDVGKTISALLTQS